MKANDSKTIQRAEGLAIARAKAARIAADADAAKAAFDDANATVDAEAAAYDAETAAEAARAAQTAYADAFDAGEASFDAEAAYGDAIDAANDACEPMFTAYNDDTKGVVDYPRESIYTDAFISAFQNAFEAAHVDATHDAAKKAATDAADACAKQAADAAAVAYARHIAAHAGLTQLVAGCAAKTGQSYKLRALLYSLWNGKPTALIEILALDRELREALLAVLRVFGSKEVSFETVPDAFKAAGLSPWFLEEGENMTTPNP